LTLRPTFRNIRSVDVFQLVVCGVCMGIALTGFIEFLRRAKIHLRVSQCTPAPNLPWQIHVPENTHPPRFADAEGIVWTDQRRVYCRALWRSPAIVSIGLSASLNEARGRFLIAEAGDFRRFNCVRFMWSCVASAANLGLLSVAPTKARERSWASGWPLPPRNFAQRRMPARWN